MIGLLTKLALLPSICIHGNSMIILKAIRYEICTWKYRNIKFNAYEK